MNVQITARHFQASAELQENLRNAVAKLEKFNGSITGVHVILDAEKAGVRRAEIVVKIYDKTVCAHAIDDNMYKAIESMMAKINRQLKRENEKLKVHRSEPTSALVAE